MKYSQTSLTTQNVKPTWSLTGGGLLQEVVSKGSLTVIDQRIETD